MKVRSTSETNDKVKDIRTEINILLFLIENNSTAIKQKI